MEYQYEKYNESEDILNWKFLLSIITGLVIAIILISNSNLPSIFSIMDRSYFDQNTTITPKVFNGISYDIISCNTTIKDTPYNNGYYMYKVENNTCNFLAYENIYSSNYYNNSNIFVCKVEVIIKQSRVGLMSHTQRYTTIDCRWTDI